MTSQPVNDVINFKSLSEAVLYIVIDIIAKFHDLMMNRTDSRTDSLYGRTKKAFTDVNHFGQNSNIYRSDSANDLKFLGNM